MHLYCEVSSPSGKELMEPLCPKKHSLFHHSNYLFRDISVPSVVCCL